MQLDKFANPQTQASRYRLKPFIVWGLGRHGCIPIKFPLLLPCLVSGIQTNKMASLYFLRSTARWGQKEQFGDRAMAGTQAPAASAPREPWPHPVGPRVSASRCAPLAGARSLRASRPPGKREPGKREPGAGVLSKFASNPQVVGCGLPAPRVVDNLKDADET